MLVPCLIAAFVIPGWPHLYASLGSAIWLPSLLFGFGWGIAQVLFGISVVRLGMSLAFTLIVGLGTVFGTLIPLATLHREALFNKNSAMLIAGCGLMVVGVVLSGIAGNLRERSATVTGEQGSASRTDAAFLIALGIAILSGVLSSMLNLSLAFGEPIASLAAQRCVDLTPLENALKEMRRATRQGDIRRLIEADLHSHLDLCKLSGNHFLHAQIRTLLVSLFAFVSMRVTQVHQTAKAWESDLDRHKRMIDLIREGDPAAAEFTVRTTLRQFAARAHEIWQKARGMYVSGRDFFSSARATNLHFYGARCVDVSPSAAVTETSPHPRYASSGVVPGGERVEKSIVNWRNRSGY
jgi:DNA-binding FadR family transcriptional regulator